MSDAQYEQMYLKYKTKYFALKQYAAERKIGGHNEYDSEGGSVFQRSQKTKRSTTNVIESIIYNENNINHFPSKWNMATNVKKNKETGEITMEDAKPKDSVYDPTDVDKGNRITDDVAGIKLPAVQVNGFIVEGRPDLEAALGAAHLNIAETLEDMILFYINNREKSNTGVEVMRQFNELADEEKGVGLNKENTAKHLANALLRPHGTPQFRNPTAQRISKVIADVQRLQVKELKIPRESTNWVDGPESSSTPAQMN